MGLPALLRSFLTLGVSGAIERTRDDLRALHEDVRALHAEVNSLKSLVRTRDDRAQRKLKAGLSSLLNMIAILPELDVKGVLPAFPHAGYEIAGEEAAFLFHLIRRYRPKLVMELGSGSSTVLLAAAVRANGSGRVVTVEHDPTHGRQTRLLLDQAELSPWVELVPAPLVPHRLGAETFSWYDLSERLAGLTEKIDFLFVDGPPGKTQSLSRYPALPILAPHLSPRAVVFVDDGGREDETRMVERWGEMDSLAFETETLDFLPHAPVLLTLSPSGRVAELRPARAEEEREPAMVAQARRGSAS